MVDDLTAVASLERAALSGPRSAPGRVGTLGAALVALGLLAWDASRLLLLPDRWQPALTDGFEAVVATLGALAASRAARRSRSVRGQWLLVTVFFANLALADIHDLLMGTVSGASLPWLHVLELAGWFSYLPLALLVVYPTARDRERSRWSWVTALDFLQVALLFGVAYFTYLYVPHAEAGLRWTVRGRAEDVRNALLTAGLLTRAAVDPSRASRALHARVGFAFAFIAFVQGVFGRVPPVHLIGRPAALLVLGILALRWCEEEEERTLATAREALARWLLGLVPAVGPLVVLAFAYRVPPAWAPVAWRALGVSVVVFILRAGAVERERLRRERTQAVFYELSERISSAPGRDEAFEAAHQLLARWLPLGDFAIVLRQPASGLARVTYRSRERADSTGGVALEPLEQQLVARVLESGTPASREDVEAPVRERFQLALPLTAGTETLGVLLVRTQARRAKAEGDRVLLALAAHHLAAAIERRRGEETVHASEERLRQAVHASQVGIFDHDHAHETIYWSAELREIFGWAETEDVSLGEFIARLHPEDRDQVTAAVRRAHDPAGDGVYQAEFRVQRQDGSVRWVGARSQTVFEGEGASARPRRTVGAVVELTERKKVEDQLREAARVLLESQRVARLGSFRTDLVAGTWVSSTILDEIFGIAGDDAAKTVSAWLGLVHPDDREELAGYFAEQVVAGRKAFDRDYRIRRRNDGKDRWVHGRGELVLAADGRPLEMIGTIQDVTERRKTEEEKTRIEALLVRAQKMEAIGRLAGGVAHDFNNLLSVIRGNGERLLAAPSDADSQRRRLEQIIWAADKGGTLTRQLLAFSSQQVLAPRVLRLDAVLEDAREILDRVLGEDVELALSTTAPLSCVRADPGQLVQVLLNLAVNARDAMPRGGRLTIEARDADVDEIMAQMHPPLAAGLYVMLRVSDSGEGMAPETLRRAFEPFFTTKPEGHGTGLGLSTVYGIVKQSEGFVWIDSEVGVGTTFTLLFPRVTEPAGTVDTSVAGEPALARASAGLARSAGEPSAAASPFARRDRRILLVEDDAGVRELMGDVLESAGYSVEVSGVPAQALITASRGGFDLLVTDVIMPGMSGSELARRAVECQPELRVLFVSGYGGDTLARRGRIEPGESFLQKPFSEAQLLDAVAGALAAKAV